MSSALHRESIVALHGSAARLLVEPSRAPAGARSRRRSVLVFRSSRQTQFRRAVASARARYPGAELWTLTHEDFAQAVRSDGIDRVVRHRAARLGILWLPYKLTRALRRRAFDAVVIPQMTRDLASAANLYRLAWWIAAPEVLVVAGDDAPAAFSRTQLAGLVRRSTLVGIPNGWLTLRLLVRALVRRRLRAPMPFPKQRRLRVLQVIDSLGMGGAQVQLAELLNHLPADRYEVDVLALSRASPFSHDHVTGPLRPSTLHEGLRTPDRILAVRNHCLNGRYDLVHTWLFESNVVGTAGAALAGVPRIVTSVRSLSPGHYPQHLPWWYRLADALASRIADVVTVNADALVADHARWARISPRRIRVLHNGIDPAPLEAARAGAREWLRTSLSLPRDACVIGTAGRLDIEKDQATFLRAVRHLVHAGLDVHAVVAGDGPLREALATLACTIGLGPERLRWLGPRTDARRVIAGLDVFVLTSQIEGFPNALLEAGFLGVPCVSSDVGGVVEVLGDDSHLFAAGDDRAAANLVAAALNRDRDAVDERVRAVSDRCARHFTAEAMATRWRNVYEM